MDMMPIMNIFNEWNAANTSKKLRAVFESNARSGKYKTNYPPYGYLKGTDKNCTPIVDPYSAGIVRRDESEWALTENNHEAIISKELWDKVREVDASVSNGKSSKNGVTMPLSGLCYCSDCGTKMKQNGNLNCKVKPCYTCGRYSRYGKEYCSSHTIRLELIESLVLQDIQQQIDFVMNEPDVRAKLLAHKQGMYAAQDSSVKKRIHTIEKRLNELDGLIQSVYEDKVAGRIPEKVCVGLLEKYQSEKDELTREIALDLIEYIKVDAHPGHRNLPRTIHIYYKLIDKPLANKSNAVE